MFKASFEAVAPPVTAQLMEEPGVQALFEVFVGVANAQELDKSGSKHAPLQPTELVVMTFLSPENRVQFSVRSQVELAGCGYVQVKEHIFESMILGNGKVGVVNCRTREVVVPDLEDHKFTLGMIGMMYLNEEHLPSEPSL